jgi:PAB-dependent poly(A)-specific ribonuclease subunit 2
MDIRADEIRNDKFQDLQCMSFTAKGTHELVVAGGQDTMFKIDVEKGTVTQVVS